MLNELVMPVIIISDGAWWDSRGQGQSERRSLDVTMITGDEANQVSDRRGHYVQDESWQKSLTVMKLRTFPVRDLAGLKLLPAVLLFPHKSQNCEFSILQRRDDQMDLYFVLGTSQICCVDL